MFDTESADWYHHYKIVNIDKPAREIKGLQFVFVEIPKFRPETVLDRKIRRLWLRFLKEIDQSEFEPPAELLAYPPTAEALEISKTASFSEAELFVYQEYLDAIRVEITLMGERTAEAEERGWDRGRKRGHEEGREEGRGEGLIQGRDEGRVEGVFAEKQAIARNLLDLLDDATIAAKTGLTVEEVTRLRQG